MEEPLSNGPLGSGDKPSQQWDPEDPETQRQMRRPPDIDQDMKEMDRRKRVEAILSSNVFREELERIIETQLREGYNPASIFALQQITEFLLPSSKFPGASALRGSSIIPIADIRGLDSLSYAKGEKLLRCKLASVYRLVDLFGWSEGIYNHITVRISQDQEHFLINPFGLLYHEITASSLIKIDLQGTVIEQGTTNFGVNVAGFTLHSAIHQARPDVRCIIHVHTPQCIAVSSMRCGFLPLSQEAALVGEVSYHDYNGVLIDLGERESIVKDLGPVNKVMFLRNHGVVCCGESVEEAFWYLQQVISACETQMKLIPAGLDNLVLISDQVMQKTAELVQSGYNVDSKEVGLGGSGDETKERPPRKHKRGELEFEALMRMLDTVGYRTGYIYKQPLQRSEPPKPKNDVEVPPTSSAYTHIFDEDDLVRFSPLKKILDSRRNQDKTRWLNSPNTYQKVEVLETGTTAPKTITKWVAEGSPTHGTSVKIENAYQFIPPGTDPQEFKRRQKEMKAIRMQSKVSAGPQSHILEGVSWDEVKKLQDAQMSGTGDQVVIVGAASKGIIQREFQHNAMVYKTPYAKNPFDSVTDEELEEYKRIVDKKQRGEPVTIEEEKFAGMILEDDEITKSTSLPKSHSPVGVDSPTLENRSLPQSPTSPLSEDEADKGRVIQVSRSRVPQASHAEPRIIINDDPTEASALALRRTQSARANTMPGAAVHGAPLHRTHSQRSPKGETALNGDDLKDGGIRSAESGENISGTSRSSKEGSPTKEAAGDSPKKDKKKKRGLRTPSFLKKKKDKKKNKEATLEAE